MSSLPSHCLSDGYNDDVDLRKPAMSRELQFFERVKNRLQVKSASRDAYPDLIKCIHLYNQELVSRAELMSLVNDILGKFPDLMVRKSVCCVHADLCPRSRSGSGFEPPLAGLNGSGRPCLNGSGFLSQSGFNEFVLKCEVMDDGRAGAAIPPAQRDAIRRGAFSKDKLLSKPLSEVRSPSLTIAASRHQCF